MRTFAAIACLLALSGCQREERQLRPEPTRLVIYGDAARQSDLQPGGPKSAVEPGNPYAGNAYAISEGQRLYSWYNCNGCHSNGGGGIGPPLIKTQWIYGGEPANLFDTIVKGRPNGMPTWGARIPEYQVWQIVAYVRSMNNLQPHSATPARDDNIQKSPYDIVNRVQGVTK